MYNEYRFARSTKYQHVAPALFEVDVFLTSQKVPNIYYRSLPCISRTMYIFSG